MNESLDALKQLLKFVVLPPVGPLVLGLLGIALATRKPRAGLRIALTAVLLLTLLAVPAFADFLVRRLDDSGPIDLTRASDARAIVVLGGGIRVDAPEYRGPTLGALSLQRVRYAAYLARRTELPILVSGGVVHNGPPEAIVMRDVLTREYHVPVRWVESRSHNTHENARNSAAILTANDISTVILVGHAFDFPRTRKEFAAAGIVAIPAPINIPPALPTEIGDFLPSAAGLVQSYYACYEILANVLFDVTHAFTGNSADTRSTPRSSSPPPRGS
jgi:uncharacterized SAM-binding protein YcdF (DUF218 family)